MEIEVEWKLNKEQKQTLNLLSIESLNAYWSL